MVASEGGGGKAAGGNGGMVDVTGGNCCSWCCRNDGVPAHYVAVRPHKHAVTWALGVGVSGLIELDDLAKRKNGMTTTAIVVVCAIRWRRRRLGANSSRKREERQAGGRGVACLEWYLCCRRVMPLLVLGHVADAPGRFTLAASAMAKTSEIAKRHLS